MHPAPIRSFEYKNDFLYIVIREEPEAGPHTYLYCCGIHLPRFCRLSWRKGGICSNPAVRGIQLLRTHVSAFAAGHDMIVTRAGINDGAPITPRANGWYHETPLRIEQASPGKVRELLEYSVLDLVKTVLVVCVPDARIPASLPNSAAMQKYLESLAVAEERTRVEAYERESLTGYKN